MVWSISDGREMEVKSFRSLASLESATYISHEAGIRWEPHVTYLADTRLSLGLEGFYRLD